MLPTPMPESNHPSLTVVCLCAGWCDICEEYRQTFASLADEFTGQARLLWVDIEDQEDVVGSLDIENFPTLLIGTADDVRFFGPITQLPGTARQLVRKAMVDELGRVADPELAQVLNEIRALQS